MKKVIAFDLDGTLAESKSNISPAMDQALSQLLRQKIVCVISGGKFDQFEKQFLANFSATVNEYANLHLMPTSGTHYLRYDDSTADWQTIYQEIIPEVDRRQIINSLKQAVEKFGYDQLETYGPQIEDRQSQVTLSALGQNIVDELGVEGVKRKEEWDPDKKKRLAIVEFVSPLLPDGVEAQTGGSSSVDVVKSDVDKAYGMTKLMEATGISKADVLFIGDALEEHGNDYPVKEMGVDCIAVAGPDETLAAINRILKN